MKKRIMTLLFGLLLPLAFLNAAEPLPAVSAPSEPDASASVEKNDATGYFQKMHAGFLARGKSGPVGVLFLGDSITEGWASVPHIWEKYYGAYQPANFGIGGDQTQHLIWRIENGELAEIDPKVVVLLIGTNNSFLHTAEEIVAAERKIIAMIQERLPETKILLLAIFPRAARKNAEGVITQEARDDATRRVAVIEAVNPELAKLDNGGSIRFLDVGPAFLGQDGKIPFSIMRDQLHLTPAGYQLWATAMDPLLSEMLK